MDQLFKTGPKLLTEVRSYLLENLSNKIKNKDEIIIVINEIMQNIYRHAYKKKENNDLMLSFEPKKDMIHFKLIDNAEHMDLNFLNQEFQPTESGKMGLKIIRDNSVSFSISPNKIGHTTLCEIKIQE